jgi:hypothetical protein
LTHAHHTCIIRVVVRASSAERSVSQHAEEAYADHR